MQAERTCGHPKSCRRKHWQQSRGGEPLDAVVSNLSCGSPVVEFEQASQPLSGLDFAS
jgi:hypothetical protein